MAFEVDTLQDFSFRASANVTALTWAGNPPTYSGGGIPQYYVVTPDVTTGNAEDIIVAISTTVQPLGIAQDAPASGPGQSVRVRTGGVSKAIAGGAISYGDLLMVNASGQVVTATAAGATNFFLIGRALTAAAEIGDVISVMIEIGATQYINA